MVFKWEKQGRVFDPTNRFEWMHGYSQVPTILTLKDRLRIYFTCRPVPDERGQYISQTSFIDVEMDDPKKIIHIHQKPVISIGETGAFDQFGIMPGSLVNFGDKLAMYYTGWSREVATPYTTGIGVAYSTDQGESFQKEKSGPVISRNYFDPYLVNGPFVLRAGEVYNMWYSSGVKWIETGKSADPIYLIKCATSNDGLNWTTNDKLVIPTHFSDEAQNRPFVFAHAGGFHMLFCYRHGADFRNAIRGYRLGYAYSSDLINWERDDDNISLIGDSGGDWDAEMMAYPSVVKVKNSLYLFYNGNQFGKFGFGYAKIAL